MYTGKVFVISLKSDIERRKNITLQLEKQKIDYEIIDAIIGKELSRETNLEIDWEFAESNSSWASKGALACSLSHLKAYRAIINQNLDFALVLEDDTILNADVSGFISKVNDQLYKNEVLLLYYATWEKCFLSTKNSIDVYKQYRIVNPINPKQLISANAYIITREACQNILEFQNPLKTICDSWGVFYENNVVKNIRCIVPMLANTGDFKSSINYVTSKSLLGRFLSIVERYKLFPLYDILRYRRKKMRESMLNFELTNE